MKKIIVLCVFSFFLIGCDEIIDVENEIEIMLPEEKADETEFVKHIKNIELIDLQVDDNYMYTEISDLRVSNNYYYFISKDLRLTCYDKQSGKLQFSKSIKGRGRGECAFANSYFTSNDNIIVNAQGKMLSYNHFGKFCGLLSMDDLGSSYILPMKDGYISCALGGASYNKDYCLTLLDSSFNVKGSYFKIPDKYKLFAHYIMSNSSPDRYVYNDTLHFLFQYTYRLYSFPEGNTYHFIPSKPIPEGKIRNLSKISDLHNFSNELESQGYANKLFDLGEVQDYIIFKYFVGTTTVYCVLVDKRNNTAFSISNKRDGYDTPLDVWAVIMGSQILYSDGKYLYARAHREAYKFLNEHSQCLDSLQMALYKSMQEKLSSSVDKDFSFFYKIELE